MPTKPTATTSHATPHSEKEATAHPTLRRHDAASADGHSSLLTNAWYSTNDLATHLGVDASTLRRWRTTRPPQGPPFVSLSERVVMYSALDVEEWLHSRRTIPHLAA
ncbi:helix-turn-helix transcriptional regulator [Streptomyces sp. NPDC052042]|uniref:helix-turn-helix transcriptional regulator n=1 Tax=Streptomyces sp. NPDC052042 TaxID=3365683 RepID=UPI0037D959B0